METALPAVRVMRQAPAQPLGSREGGRRQAAGSGQRAAGRIRKRVPGGALALRFLADRCLTCKGSRAAFPKSAPESSALILH